MKTILSRAFNGIAPYVILALVGLLAFVVCQMPVFAQGEDAISTDPADWYKSPLVGGAVVKIVIDLIRKHIWKSLDGRAVLAVVAGLVVVLTLGGVVTKLLVSDPVGYAIGAFVAATGLNLALTQIGGKTINAQGKTAADLATRSRAGL